MSLPLAVIGRGAVTPAGIGPGALHAGTPSPVMAGSVRREELAWPVLRVDPKAPELGRWQREPRLRRASPLTLFLVEAAEQALAGVPPGERAATGLVVALSAGCLAYTHRFFGGILDQGRKMASPALFPETVFNSPGSHVAATLKLNGAAAALLGDETAWISALRTAALWLRRGRVRQVLVLAGEEFDPVMLDAYSSMRWLGRPGVPGPRGFLPGEGAAAVLVRVARDGDPVVLAGMRDGFLHRRPAEAVTAAERLFAGLDPAWPVWPTAASTWLEPLERKMLAGRRVAGRDKSFPHLGQAFTASAGWSMLRALEVAAEKPGPLVLPIWGLNHQLGTLIFDTRGR